ncbi:MAG: Rieske (2Fe-2S) protein [Candidatus Bathyarchaeota archaeon]
MGKLVRLANVSEIQEDKPQAFKVDGEEVFVINFQGQLYAIENRCTHLGCILSNFYSLDGKEITCKCHLARFDITTGICIIPPTIGLKVNPLKTYRIVVENSDVFLDL